MAAKSITTNDAKVYFTDETDTILSISPIGWAENWNWDKAVISKPTSIDSGNNYKLAFNKNGLIGEIKETFNESSILVELTLEATKHVKNSIGAGIEIAFNYKGARLKNIPKPSINVGSNVISWSYGNQKIEISLSGDIGKLRYNKEKTLFRLFLHSGDINLGDIKSIKLNIFHPQSFNFIDPIKKEKALESHLEKTKSFDEFYSPYDLSFLNHTPAGKYGFLKSEGDKFFFDNQGNVRFWGVNIQAYSLFVHDKDKIRKHAERLARFGINIARLHHHDSSWVKENLIALNDDSRTINLDALDNYFFWIKCLKENGIYVWIDLQVQRPWKANDKIPGWQSDLEKYARNGFVDQKGFVYLNRRMQELTMAFNEELLTTTNKYTGLALKDDPAVALIQITNENDLTHHFGNLFLPNQKNPYHQNLFEKYLDKYALEHGIPHHELWKTWLPGKSKLLLNEIEARYFLKIINHLREIGVKVPISTTSAWGKNPLSSIPAITVGDFVDTHGYATKDFMFKNPKYTPNYLHWFSSYHVAKMPLTISEVNLEDSERSPHLSFGIPPYTAAIGAGQGWDAIIFYGYSQDGFKGQIGSQWSFYTNPEFMSSILVGAILFRESHIEQHQQTQNLNFNHINRYKEESKKSWYSNIEGFIKNLLYKKVDDTPTLLSQNLTPVETSRLRNTLEKRKIILCIPSIKALHWLTEKECSEDSISKTGNSESMVERNWQYGQFNLVSPLSIGYINYSDLSVQNKQISQYVETNSKKGMLFIQSLSRERIENSEKILITRIGNSANVLKIPSNVSDLYLYASDKKVKLEYINNSYLIDFSEIGDEFVYQLSR